MIVLDTDVLSFVQDRQGPQYRSLRRRLDATQEEAYTTVVSFEEQVRGWLSQIARATTSDRQIVVYARLQRLIEDYRGLPLLRFDEAAAKQFEELRRQRVRIGTMDLRIASIALANDALLISRNLVD